ncbi:restriction endonuclease subunit S [uncultured Phascolarctobacterium sp.]|uniref:restriction endonuclease subunit S n=1 Tax=uncultured Phascolarctobacterium sp. TaxID=512296 RepID=UPI0025EF2622|nr:restriction endonuclease subunit S [uncultured Phascolarctobacterium sp.]
MPKKKTALTIEERLQQALVPAEEQPYEVPENWVWVRLESVASWGSGGTPSRKHEEYYNGDILWIKTGELNNGWIYDTEEKITDEGLKKSSAKLFPTYSVLIAMYGATIGKVAILGVPATTNQACACAVCNQSLLYMYLFYYCISQKNVFIEKGKGGAQPNISQIILKQHPVPLPPLSEQQRIVERIEELFAKLDEAKERLQEVADSFAVRKATILHKAFTGELTKQWRRENGVGDESWEEKAISDICSSLKYGTSKKSSDDGEVVVLRMGNLQNGEIDWSNLAYTSDEEDIKKYLLKPGDILFNRTNSPELVGKTSIYRGEMPAIYAGYLIKLDYEKNIVVGDYLNYYLNSSKAKEYYMQVKTDGVSQSNINAKKIGEFEIPLPTLPEQHEIVRLIDDLLARERAAQQAAEQALASIDLMKKSILARAFRGELGTNKASEASALELLQQVLAEN